ncbi:DeoR/GlpR family DNA-binding transcription regulator [Alicyclobacillus fastidiosus]|uniref:DeoR/GlpR family DNA-binding transcription regulator n=1 Tax=Alicyclobacillus fastidiosus TaxID=392011 RepID=A0ABY6ZJE7_9BACL|nr:DeoR/GlpR family DNA-binding transcription regulator [Alicyclobacillus fastidiosus]WAH43022.1 DeoR/GlpR family DNA-binding transcription regulator [Alicyclobacillus fastidiosus]GMA64998.1 DeoR family transcriptional regulator [Alicyclobacillus fastidiosus]
MVKVKDVAKAAGTSPATVSRVLNGVSTVNPEIANRVRQAIQDLNYHPNEAGRNLRRKTDNQLGPDFELRSRHNWEAKQRIAVKAAEFIKPSDVVVLDSGSTVAGMVPFIDEGTLLYTNSLAILQPAARRNLHVHLAPGLYIPEMAAVFGEETEAYFRNRKATKYFLSSARVDVRTGLWNVNHVTSAVKRAAIECANQVILMVDHDKFCDSGLAGYASLSQVNVLITDYVPTEFREQVIAAGIELIEVGQSSS